ncbi:sensor histidine kinase [Senegalia sp. (in: firmicutes)]|uniref:sensor histidine kinase n=1 Tax=Senegalia sp. (in: firmicutes) TaxID=1924098 RepID=UPI003F9B437B
MTIFESFILSIFDILGFIIISNALLSEEVFKNKYRVIMYLLSFSFTIIPIDLFIPLEFASSMTFITTFIMIYLLYKKSIKETVFIWGTTTIIVIATQLISVLPIFILTGGLKEIFLYGLISNSIFIALIILISSYMRIHLIYDFIKSKNDIFMNIGIVIFILITIIFTYSKINRNNLVNNIIFYITISLIIMFIYFIIIKNGLRNEYEAKELEMYKRDLPIIDSLLNEVRRKQHEFDNHIQAINSAMYSGNNNDEIVEILKEYTSEIEDINDLGNLIKLKDKILAGFLFTKQKEAEKNNIKFNVIIENPSIETKLKSYELIEVLGNLIDNAFETEIKDNVVIISFLRKYGNDIIEVSNKHPRIEEEGIEKFFEKEFSTKKKKGRGYGLYNIKERLKKYNVEILVENEYREEYESNFISFRIII